MGRLARLLPTLCVPWAIALALGAAAIHAEPAPPAVDPSIGKVEVTLDVPKNGDKPYVGEMILLRMRSFVRADIERDEIIQPPLLNFSWQQLGRDKPISAMVNEGFGQRYFSGSKGSIEAYGCPAWEMV